VPPKVPSGKALSCHACQRDPAPRQVDAAADVERLAFLRAVLLRVANDGVRSDDGCAGFREVHRVAPVVAVGVRDEHVRDVHLQQLGERHGGLGVALDEWVDDDALAAGREQEGGVAEEAEFHGRGKFGSGRGVSAARGARRAPPSP
jgi:hypothetical protein